MFSKKKEPLKFLHTSHKDRSPKKVSSAILKSDTIELIISYYSSECHPPLEFINFVHLFLTEVDFSGGLVTSQCGEKFDTSFLRGALRVRV